MDLIIIIIIIIIIICTLIGHQLQIDFWKGFFQYVNKPGYLAMNPTYLVTKMAYLLLLGENALSLIHVQSECHRVFCNVYNHNNRNKKCNSEIDLHVH